MRDMKNNDEIALDASGEELLRSLSFCVIDLETTGGNHQFDKIIEVGLVKIRNLEITDELSFLIQPEIDIPEFIQKLTSISPNDLHDAPTIDETIDEILEFIGDSILVAHNSSFDVPFLNSVLVRLNRPKLDNRSLCTNLMTKYLIPDIMNSNLNYMSRIFEISHDQAHRALEDANATAHLLLTYLDFFIGKNIKKINHLYYPRNKYELDRTHLKKDQSSHEEVLAIIEKTTSPLFIVAKGTKGVFLATIPIENPKEEKDFLDSFLKGLDWDTLTLRMMGSFFETLMQFNHTFPKSDPQHQEAVLDYLVSSKLPEMNPALNFKSHELPHFLLTNHLIPEQYVLFPLFNLQYKSEIIFRFPSHKKKLLQYIQNQSRRFREIKGKKKKIRNSVNPKVESFLVNYLKYIHESANGSMLFFDRKIALKEASKFEIMLNNFISQNKNTYNYPKKHI